MGVDYLLVHVKYTIPPALLLTLLFRPLQTRLDTYKLGLLLTIAVVSTVPWDSHLISVKIWSYPPSVVLGISIFSIPIEEFFFFFIQTYNTSVVYLLFSKTTVNVAYLNEINEDASRRRVKWQRMVGASVAAVLLWTITQAMKLARSSGSGLYLGLLIIWAMPFMLGLWCISYQHILSLPLRNTLVPIAIPTIYLWIVDTIALRRGTWIIASETKLDIQPWKHMEIEEIIFFLLTNVLIVFGLVAFDYAVALVTAFPVLFPSLHSHTSLKILATSGSRALCTWSFPKDEYHSLQESIDILKRKSRSFYLASGVFDGRLRLDLISLYSFCRAADDLIDDSPAPELSLGRLQMLLELVYDPERKLELESFVASMFPKWAHAPLLSLPAHKIPRTLLDELLQGFRTDMCFPELSENPKRKDRPWPIKSESDLLTYSYQVAGTVGEMFLHLVFSHTPPSSHTRDIAYFLKFGQKMGIALQYINIARDIHKDAAIGRVYIPSAWLQEAGITEEAIIVSPQLGECFRPKLLRKAREMYEQSRSAIEFLPDEARAGARVAVEGYMDIGRQMGEGYCERKRKWGRYKMVRVWRAWKVMRG